ncbi:unnamed protein product [Owenia fusiformis]|uniref:Uncharacterized protein n=1 Tax=Owenia fusiformis TaxID=6347 RepID=A0A8J1UTD2_OWEFU|nr:unnamed protein product [Owenia fusiformis]
MEAEDNVEFEHHTPKHPLPEEIRKMGKDDTVCKFCGVSYLIHREIKALEDKLKATEKQLQLYIDCEQKEKEARLELEKVQSKFDGLNTQINERNSQIEKLEQLLKERGEKIEALAENRKTLEEKLSTAIQDAETSRSSMQSIRRNLPGLLHSIRQQRSELTIIQTNVHERDKVFKQETDKLHTVIKETCNKELNDLTTMHEKMVQLENENIALKDKDEFTNLELKAAQKTNEKLNEAEKETQNLQQKCSSLQSKVKELQIELDGAVSRSRMISIESQQYKEQLRNKSKELEDVQSNIRNTEQHNLQQIQKLQLELKSKESEIQSAQHELESFQRKFQRQQEAELEIKRQATEVSTEKSQLRDSLSRVQSELTSMKAEREQMISIHQNRIEELRQSFKNKMAEAERWPEKLEEVLSKEKRKHNKELRMLEEKLKQNFVMEMQIEQQKHQELLDKYKSEHRDDNSNTQNQLALLQKQHSNEIAGMRKENNDYRARTSEIEQELRGEISSLKAIIQDLEDRLAKLDVGNEGLVSALKVQVIEKASEADDLRQEINALENDLKAKQEDILFLQETVRKECEERFELMETLSETKEQLLSFKRPSGGYQSPNQRDNMKPIRSNSTSSEAGHKNSIGSIANPQPGGVTPQPHPPPPRDFLGNSSSNSSMAREYLNNVQTVGFDGEKSRSPGKLKGNSVTDSRKRIANAMGRR